MLAMMFKLINVPFFACHLLAIALLGVGFDIAWAMVSRFKSMKLGLPLTGIMANYIGRALFAVVITYLIRYEYWTAPGLPKVIDYIFISGSISALGSMIAVPVGHRLGSAGRMLSWPRLHPRFSTLAVLSAVVCIWIFQQAL